MQKNQQQPIRATLPQKNSTPTQPHLSPPQKNKEHLPKNIPQLQRNIPLSRPKKSLQFLIKS